MKKETKSRKKKVEMTAELRAYHTQTHTSFTLFHTHRAFRQAMLCRDNGQLRHGKNHLPIVQCARKESLRGRKRDGA